MINRFLSPASRSSARPATASAVLCALASEPQAFTANIGAREFAPLHVAPESPSVDSRGSRHLGNGEIGIRLSTKP